MHCERSVSSSWRHAALASLLLVAMPLLAGQPAQAGPFDDACRSRAPSAACDAVAQLCTQSPLAPVCGALDDMILRETKIVASNAHETAFFGSSLAYDGTTLVVGAPHLLDANNVPGAAYVYERDANGTWREIQLPRPSSVGMSFFGASVAVEGDVVVVGSPWHMDSLTWVRTGAVHLYTRGPADTWSIQTIFPPVTHQGRDFGTAVALSDGVLVMGAPLAYTGFEASGAAFVFTLGGNPSNLYALHPADGKKWDFFGIAVATHDGRIVVGAPGHDAPGRADAGAAYLYERDGLGGWIATKFAPQTLAAGDLYGNAVAVHGDRALVGAPHDSERAFWAGAAYLHTSVGPGVWTATKITPSNADVTEFFGTSVALLNDRALIGAWAAGPTNAETGRAYEYALHTGGSMTETERSTSQTQQWGAYGWNVALSETGFAVAASQDNERGDRAGAVFVYENGPLAGAL